jgi:hypothetical protein
MTNLEPLCAKYGHRMINGNDRIQDQENIITKALGVLAESGLYAMCVFFLSCSKKKYGKEVLTEHLRQLWQDPGVGILADNIGDDPAILLTEVRRVAENLPTLILTRRITEQALTFARYHAKAGVPMNREEA